MRRSLVLLVILVAAGSAITAATAAGAAAGGSSRLIVCPLAHTGHITTCCPPPTVQQTPCCACCACCASAAIACNLGITINSSRDPSIAGHKVTVSGRMSSPGAGIAVALWQEIGGGSSFKEVAQTTTDSTGGYQFVRTGVNTNRQWYVTAGVTRSLTFSQNVKAVVMLSRSLHLQVSPGHAGERIAIERRTSQGWKTIVRPRLGSGSRLLLQISVRHRRSITLRAVLPADKRNAESFSKAIRITG